MVDLSRYQEMIRTHEWVVPERYNVAADVADKHPRDKLAMIWTDNSGADRRIFWGELQDLAAQFANRYAEMGVGEGDRVAILLPPRPESAAAIVAVLKLGAIGVPMALLWSDDSLRYRLSDAGVRLLVTDEKNAARGLSGHAESTFVVSGPESVSGCSTAFETADTGAADPALIYYTSGSTGNPKGVVSPHRGLIGHNEFGYCQDLRDGETSYWMGDWAWGVYKILGPWRYGAVNFVYATERRYDPEGLLAALSRHQVSNLFVNPTGLRLMMREVPDAGRRFPQAFRVCCSANEPLGEAESAWFTEQFGIPVLQNYGMTEAYPMAGNFLGVPAKPGSMGLPVPGWDVRVLDEHERELGPGEPGEICLRAGTNPQYPLGYWNRPEESARTFGGEWFHTGDAAYADADGYLFYLGRRDDLIKSSGYRISPAEVEEACVTHPAVLEAAVIGVPDPERGQRVKAFVIPEPGREAGAELAADIKEFVRANHSAFGYPKVIEFVDDLPRSQSGKVSRAPLRARRPGTEY
ncbi:acyl-CoA synthetase [Nonomuraea sp. NPDC046802]|uniref:acyl-CoA synthetase n=1 Tax=Nonomuraea sp. NPDC046802 TaxID=3154919 RepID=UPI0033DDB92A